nr:MAG TPA: hypothetical protein [Caudoviricetes sp.]
MVFKKIKGCQNAIQRVLEGVLIKIFSDIYYLGERIT